MDATFLLKNTVWVFALSLVGVLGCMILLAVAMNMYGQECKTKTGAEAPERPAPWAEALRRWWNARPAASAPPAPSEPAPAVSAPAGAALEVLRVLRHPLTGRLVVEIAGQRYTAAGEITDPEVRQGLEVTLRDLARFAGAPSPTAPEPPPAAPRPIPPPAAPEPPQPPVEPGSNSPAVPVPPPAASSGPLGLNALPPAPKSAGANPAVRVPSMNPFKQMQILREVGPREPAAPMSIAEQIDEVLQQLIAGTPFAARDLHVRSGPRDSVAFEADRQVYPALDALQDETVQAVFREAIRQWEARS